MDVLMTGAADDKGLATACRHLLNPCRPFGPPRASEVLEVSDVVHFDLFPRTTELAGVGQEPFDHFRLAAIPDARGIVTEEDCRGATCEGDTAPLCHQWRSIVAPFDADL